MKKIITRVCALCLAASMVFPSGQAMAGEIQKEAPGQYAVYSEDSQNEMPDDSSESTNHKKGEDDSEINMEKADGDRQQPSENDGRKELEKRDSRLKMTKTNAEQQGKVQLRLIRVDRQKQRRSFRIACSGWQEKRFLCNSKCRRAVKTSGG